MQSRADSSAETKKLAAASVSAALALIFSYLEAVIPFGIGILGIKLGLPNIVIILALYRMGFKYALTINIVRIFLSGLLFNGLFGTLYSLAGGLTSLFTMWLLKKTRVFSMVGVSMAGGVAHNVGQLLAASILLSNLKMFLYLPVLTFGGLASGIAMGIVASALDGKMPKGLFG